VISIDERSDFERLIDYLQVAVPLVGRLQITAEQQAIDAKAAELALANAIAILRTLQRDLGQRKVDAL
jgi:hypothetical protein